MKMFKRFAACFLAAMLALSLFTACGGGGGDDGGTQTVDVGYQVVRSIGASSSIVSDSDLEEIADICYQKAQGELGDEEYKAKYAEFEQRLTQRGISSFFYAVGTSPADEATAVANAKAAIAGKCSNIGEMKYYGYNAGYRWVSYSLTVNGESSSESSTQYCAVIVVAK